MGLMYYYLHFLSFFFLFLSSFFLLLVSSFFYMLACLSNSSSRLPACLCAKSIHHLCLFHFLSLCILFIQSMSFSLTSILYCFHFTNCLPPILNHHIQPRHRNPLFSIRIHLFLFTPSYTYPHKSPCYTTSLL